MSVRRLEVNSYIRSQRQYLREVNYVYQKARSQQLHYKSNSIFERGQLCLSGGQTVSDIGQSQ